ncbi:MAG: hypothetical protein EXR64_05315 [Dehalococcoidia bacterium]|nr:hypothetical protein [Dehalococcoidia bacterium]
MRFTRADLPGMLIAALAPAALLALLLNAFALWDHDGTPLIANLAVGLGAGAGLAGACARFVRHRAIVLGLGVALALDIAAVIAMQRAGLDGTTTATALKLGGVALFLCVNAVIAYDLVDHGLLPILDRRAARRAASRARDVGA